MADDAEGAALLYFFEVLTAHVRIVPGSCPSGHPEASGYAKKNGPETDPWVRKANDI
jgi:hypothetical protein